MDIRYLQLSDEVDRLAITELNSHHDDSLKDAVESSTNQTTGAEESLNKVHLSFPSRSERISDVCSF